MMVFFFFVPLPIFVFSTTLIVVLPLLEVCALAEGPAGVGVLPAIDHGRVAAFVKFWRGVEAAPEWLLSVCDGLARFADPRARHQKRGRGGLDW